MPELLASCVHQLQSRKHEWTIPLPAEGGITMGLAQDVIDPHGVKVDAIQDLRLVTLDIEVEQVDVSQPVLGEDISQHHAPQPYRQGRCRGSTRMKRHATRQAR